MNRQKTAFLPTYDRRITQLQDAMTKLEEELGAISAQVSKVGAELTGQVEELATELKEALTLHPEVRVDEDGIPPRVAAVLAEIKTKLAALDQVVPDAVPDPEPAPAEPEKAVEAEPAPTE
jgi:hypothetical protein